jgi:hypothetical protein
MPTLQLLLFLILYSPEFILFPSSRYNALLAALDHQLLMHGSVHQRMAIEYVRI